MQLVIAGFTSACPSMIMKERDISFHNSRCAAHHILALLGWWDSPRKTCDFDGDNEAIL
jgi:hypothetical protein